MTAPWNVRDWFREDIRHDTPEHVTVWQGWFTRHGIDPAEVLLAEWVERRTSPPSIVWLEAGVRDGKDIHVERSQQLPGPPEPFPFD